MSEGSVGWHHSPLHVFMPDATYIVTASTAHRAPLFVGDIRLAMVQDALFEVAQSYDWELQAWAIFPNHYHLVAHTRPHAADTRKLTQRLHSQTARELNRLDGKPGRQVWFQYWDTGITFEKSYYARLSYVHNNPVKHGLVPVADQYRFCSASWFRAKAEPSFVRKVESFRYDTVTVEDDF